MPDHINNIDTLYKYFHLSLVAYIIALVVNVRFNFVNVNANLVLGSVALFGVISIVLSVLYKIEKKKQVINTGTVVFQYKHSKILWKSLGLGFLTIVVTRDADSIVKLLALSIGVYLMLSTIIEYLAGQYFKTNIIAITDKSILDLNGRVKEVWLKNIKGYQKKNESIVINERYDTHKVSNHDFIGSPNIIEAIDAFLIHNHLMNNDVNQ